MTELLLIARAIVRGLLSRAQIAAGIITGCNFFSHDSIGVAELLIKQLCGFICRIQIHKYLADADR